MKPQYFLCYGTRRDRWNRVFLYHSLQCVAHLVSRLRGSRYVLSHNISIPNVAPKPHFCNPFVGYMLRFMVETTNISWEKCSCDIAVRKQNTVCLATFRCRRRSRKFCGLCVHHASGGTVRGKYCIIYGVKINLSAIPCAWCCIKIRTLSLSLQQE